MPHQNGTFTAPRSKARRETACQEGAAGKAVSTISNTVPKKQKTPKKSAAAENHDSAEGSPKAARSESSAPAKNRKLAEKTSSRKGAAPRPAKVRKTPAKSAFAEPTPEQIQLRAYFISEHRHRHGTPGDHHSDWLEARRQLMIEAQRN
jgi:Protein of unknown function (DUF2934)